MSCITWVLADSAQVLVLPSLSLLLQLLLLLLLMLAVGVSVCCASIDGSLPTASRPCLMCGRTTCTASAPDQHCHHHNITVIHHAKVSGLMNKTDKRLCMMCSQPNEQLCAVHKWQRWFLRGVPKTASVSAAGCFRGGHWKCSKVDGDKMLMMNH